MEAHARREEYEQQHYAGRADGLAGDLGVMISEKVGVEGRLRTPSTFSPGLHCMHATLAAGAHRAAAYSAAEEAPVTAAGHI